MQNERDIQEALQNYLGFSICALSFLAGGTPSKDLGVLFYVIIKMVTKQNKISEKIMKQLHRRSFNYISNTKLQATDPTHDPATSSKNICRQSLLDILADAVV